MLVRTIELCRLTGPDEGGAVSLELREASGLHRVRLASTDVQELLGELLRELVGRDIQLTVRVGDGETRSEPDRQPKQPGAAVRMVAEKFDGQILDLDD